MPYTIRIHYQTGDSFRTDEETDDVGAVWHDKEQARVALSYIKEHYQFYQEANASWSRGRTIKEIKEDVLKKPWCMDGEYWEWRVVVPCMDGEQELHAFWCGYFERLISATIVSLEEDEDSYSPE